MITENTFDKSKLISELKEIHIELVKVYKNIFDYKYKTNEDFQSFIDKEYKENRISSGEQQVWNDNFCHRASYTLLNKILFIRICEDIGFMLNPEDYVAGEPKDPHIGKKLSRIGLQKWANLVTNYTLGELVKLAFLDMKKSYGNIALYKDDKYEILTPSTEELSLKYLGGDEKTQELVLQFENTLSNIVEKLDTGNYNFNNTDGNILGDVYEKFMDRETRKAIGQFYTPEFVIEYILKDTVAKADVVEKPFVSVADISCGSGHFLIMAYDVLREKFINNIELLRDKYADEVYTIKRNGKEEELTGRDYWKEENIHYHLLKHCIYGADIDSFAIQLTTINLLLKDLDNFTDELNIVGCDSLINWQDFYDWKYLKEQLNEEFETVEILQLNLLNEEEKVKIIRLKENYILKYKTQSGFGIEEKISKEIAQDIINLCEFWYREFDYVIGNPPYLGQKGNKSLFEKYKNDEYWNKHYERKQDIYYYFIIKGIKILTDGGKLGFITPPYWLTANASTKLKEFLIKNAVLEKVYDFGNEKIFDAQIDGNIFIFNKSSKKEVPIQVRQYDKNSGRFNEFVSRITNDNLTTSMWNIFSTSDEGNIFSGLKCVLLGEIATISPGIQTGADYVSKSHIDKLNLEDVLVNEGIYVINEETKKKNFQESDQIYIKPFYKNSNIESYFSNLDTDKYILITNEIEDINIYPNIKKHLLKYKKILDNRYRNFALKKADKEGKWYALYGYRPNTNFDGPKIVTPYRGKVSKFSYVDAPYYASIDVFYINLNSSNYDYLFIVGILNSFLILFWLEKNCKKKGENFEFYTEPLSNIPIIDVDKDQQLEVIDVVKDIIKIKKDIYKLINFNAIFKSNDIFKAVEEVVRKLIIFKGELTNLEKKLNEIIYRLYAIDKDTKKYIENYLINKGKINKELDKHIIIEEFISNLKTYISNKIITFVKDAFIDKKSQRLNQIKNKLEKELFNFYDLTNFLKGRETTKKSINIIKDIINTECYSWSSYRKAKLNQDIKKSFITYFDNNCYGLAEWSDEVHKNYFLDAIEGYTVNNPNEKKAKDILELFKDLNIEDKQDYIEVIEEKIRKTFK